MKMLTIITAAVLALSSCELPGENEIMNNQNIVSELTIEDVTDQTVTDLIFIREEEKVARDVYVYLYDKWGATAFTNIAQSEQKHMDAVKVLLDQLQLDDPVGDNGYGEFTNQDLQALYNTLIVAGNGSLEDALAVGALIEEVDIADLNEMIEDTDNATVLNVYNNLLKGSRNHLRSYFSNLQTLDVTYEPQVLEEEYFLTIVNSEMEKGGNGQGNGQGNGRRGGW